MTCVFLTLVALRPGPPHFVPLIALHAGDLFGQIEAFKAHELAGFGDKSVGVKLALRIMCNRHMRCASLTDRAGQAAGVDASDGYAATRRQPVRQMPGGAPVGWLCWIPFDHHARGDRISGFVILRGHACVADVREGESHDLARIGWVGHDLLVAGHRCVETQFRHRLAGCAKSASVKQGSIGHSKAGSRC